MQFSCMFITFSSFARLYAYAYKLTKTNNLPLSSNKGRLFCNKSFLLFLSVHGKQELFVRLCLNQTVANGIHSLDGVHLCNILAHNPHTVQRGLIL